MLYEPADAIQFGSSEAYYLSFLEGAPGAQLLWHRDAKPYRHIVSINIRKYVLAMQNFGKELKPCPLCCATLFSLLGCMLDNSLDSGTAEERERALQILDWERGCGCYFTGVKAGGNGLEDAMLTEIGMFLQSIRFASSKKYECLLVQIRRAVYAEFCSVSEININKGCQYALDKSVLFTFLGFCLAASGNLSRREIQLCRMVGQVFGLFDDLCDLEEDQALGQLNSILCQACSATELLHCIDQAFLTLDRLLNTLSRYFSPEFYNFLLYELRIWTLCNHYIADRSRNQVDLTALT